MAFSSESSSRMLVVGVLLLSVTRAARTAAAGHSPARRSPAASVRTESAAEPPTAETSGLRHLARAHQRDAASPDLARRSRGCRDSRSRHRRCGIGSARPPRRSRRPRRCSAELQLVAGLEARLVDPLTVDDRAGRRAQIDDVDLVRVRRPRSPSASATRPRRRCFRWLESSLPILMTSCVSVSLRTSWSPSKMWNVIGVATTASRTGNGPQRTSVGKVSYHCAAASPPHVLA